MHIPIIFTQNKARGAIPRTLRGMTYIFTPGRVEYLSNSHSAIANYYVFYIIAYLWINFLYFTKYVYIKAVRQSFQAVSVQDNPI